MVVTAEQDGWDTVRGVVLSRDRHSCVAVNPSLWKGIEVLLAASPCRNRTDSFEVALRLDHIGMFKTFLRKPPDSEAFLQSICDYHHDTWATNADNRHASRERLSALYPEEWAEWLAR